MYASRPRHKPKRGPGDFARRGSGSGRKNAQDGIGGKLLQVTIADDGNEANVATRIATAFADDPQILGVVGHNASDASLAAAPIKDDFVASVVGQGSEIVDVGCDIAAPNFNPTEALSRLAQQNADSLLIAPHIYRIDLSIQLAKVNQQRFPLLSSATLYTSQRLEGKGAIENLVLPVLWHPSTNPAFAKRATDYWNGTVNWRTATSYDATQALISAIAMNSPATREKIQSTLRSGSFSAVGAGGEIRFLSTGDRSGKSSLVQIKAKGSTYKFVPIPMASPSLVPNP